VRRTPIALFCLTLAAAAPAWAQSPEDSAAAMDQEAREAFGRGEFKRAAERFEEANRLAPHAELRYNAALAWDKAGEKARAADGYEAALRQGGLDEKRANVAKSALAGLKQTLGYVKFVGPIGGVLSVAHLEHAPIPAQFHLAPGNYDVAVERADGSTGTRSIQVRAGEVVSAELEAEKPVLGDPSPVPHSAAVTEDAPKESIGSSSQATWGWVALGGGVVLGGVGAYFGTQTLAAHDDYEASNLTDADARDRGVRDRLITNVAFAGAVVAVTVGGYLLLTSGGSESSARSEPQRPRHRGQQWSSLTF
jgi:hypothetical protein